MKTTCHPSATSLDYIYGYGLTAIEKYDWFLTFFMLSLESSLIHITKNYDLITLKIKILVFHKLKTQKLIN